MENLVWQDDFKDKQENTRYEIKYDYIYRRPHKSKLNLFLEDTSKDLLSILRNPHGQSIKEIPNGVRTVPVLLRKILTHKHTHTRICIYMYAYWESEKKKRKIFTSNFSGYKHGVSSIASCTSTYMLVIFHTYNMAGIDRTESFRHVTFSSGTFFPERTWNWFYLCCGKICVETNKARALRF